MRVRLECARGYEYDQIQYMTLYGKGCINKKNRPAERRSEIPSIQYGTTPGMRRAEQRHCGENKYDGDE